MRTPFPARPPFRSAFFVPRPVKGKGLGGLGGGAAARRQACDPGSCGRQAPAPRATQHGKSAHHAAPCAKRGAEAALASRHLADSGHWSPFATALSSRCNKNIIPCADPSRRDAPPHGAHMNTSIFRTTALALSTLLFVAACQPSGNQAQTGERSEEHT